MVLLHACLFLLTALLFLMQFHFCSQALFTLKSLSLFGALALSLNQHLSHMNLYY